MCLMTTARRYGGRSGEERRSARRDKLIAAAGELLVSGGLAAVTVSAVCDRAGLIRRYFYESFGDRDALLDAAFDQFATEAAVEIFGAAAAAPAEPRERLRVAFTAAIDALTTQPGLGRMWAEMATDDTMMRHRMALTRKVAELSGQYAHLVFGPNAYDDSRARMAVLFVVGGCAEIVLNWLTGRLDVEREDVIETCTDLLLSGGSAMLPTLTTPPLP